MVRRGTDRCSPLDERARSLRPAPLCQRRDRAAHCPPQQPRLMLHPVNPPSRKGLRLAGPNHPLPFAAVLRMLSPGKWRKNEWPSERPGAIQRGACCCASAQHFPSTSTSIGARGGSPEAHGGSPTAGSPATPRCPMGSRPCGATRLHPCAAVTRKASRGNCPMSGSYGTGARRYGLVHAACWTRGMCLRPVNLCSRLEQAWEGQVRGRAQCNAA